MVHLLLMSTFGSITIARAQPNALPRTPRPDPPLSSPPIWLSRLLNTWKVMALAQSFPMNKFMGFV
uniref:Secreted protein n=1 Tax=Phakopsora pachyrhizi TaxID=170000 RepID=A0A0S1MIL1_PHAPC